MAVSAELQLHLTTCGIGVTGALEQYNNVTKELAFLRTLPMAKLAENRYAVGATGLERQRDSRPSYPSAIESLVSGTA